MPDPLASKTGGVIAWPTQEHWPLCEYHDIPMAAVLQLSKADVPEMQFRAESDIFQLLWCPQEHDDDLGCGPHAEARWRCRADLPDQLGQPASEINRYEDDDNVPRECRLFPERITENPPITDPELLANVNKWLAENAQRDMQAMQLHPESRECAYEGFFAESPGSKVGGFVSYIQDEYVPLCVCGASTEHLLTLSSGDGESGNRWGPSDIPRDHLGNTMCHLVQKSDTCFGDCGSVFVFVCRVCSDWPVYALMQCS